jgi:hypothetical protein
MPICCMVDFSSDFFKDTSTGEITSCQNITTTSSSDFKRFVNLEDPQNVLHNVEAAYSARQVGTARDQIIIVAVKTHERLLLHPFKYTLNELVTTNTNKVVVVCCMTRVRSESEYQLKTSPLHLQFAQTTQSN